MDLEKLKELLEVFKTDVKAMIEVKSKEGNDAANKIIGELQTKLLQAETSLEEVKKAIKKPFGLPGLETEKARFDWAKYFTGLYKNYQAGKGEISASEAKDFWDKSASFEHAVCKDYNASDGSSGGFIVPPQIYQGDVIDVVYANTAILKLPILKFTNLKGDMPIPVDNGHLASYHLSETGAPAKTSAGFSLEWLRPKKIGVYVPVSNRLLYETSNAIQMIVKGKMAMDASVELSRGVTNGIGANKEGKGILQYYAQMTGIGDLSTNGRRFTIDDIADMKQALAEVDELRDTNTYGTLMHPSVFWGMLRETVESYSGQPSNKGMQKLNKLLLDQTDIENGLKVKVESTTQIPKTTVGTSATCSKVITGDWSKFAYATFRDPIFRVSDQASDSTGRSALLNDEIFMVMFLEYDCVCLRASAFAGRDGAETLKAKW